MKKTQRDIIPANEEFEDLTLFANESFDTQDVDLFEFTSEESSPLTRLKSIILSLDWEINDEILQELADELDNLQSMWQGDKVAEAYLQGLSKIGNYIRTKGAYAHPNSIKLLLTFFYNFEKIISSQNITGEQITQLLKGDVRKFRILQYQITQSEDNTPEPVAAAIEPTAPPVSPVAPPAESNAAKLLKAAILSLDWEVTDESLAQFNNTLAASHQQMTGNKPALVLLQGLQALSDYIAEERAEAHPESFTLLHSFNEALEQVTQTETAGLDQAAVQELLVDRINRLNTLKMLIANQLTTPVNEQLIDHVVDEISAPIPAPDFGEPEPFSLEAAMTPASLTDRAPAEESWQAPGDDASEAIGAEIDTLFAFDAKPAMETSDTQYPDEILPPDAIHPVSDELADDFIEAHLNTKRGLMPALSDSEELAGFNEAAEPFDLPAQSDLAEQLDFLFADAEKDSKESFAALSTADADALELELELEDDGPAAALADVDFSDVDFKFESDGVVAALSDVDMASAPGRDDDSDADANSLDIQSKLDDFFTDAMAEEPAQPAVKESVEEIEQSLFFDQEHGIQAALADSDEERGFSEEEAVAALDYTPMDEIEQKLDFFFGADTEETVETADAVDVASTFELSTTEDEFAMAPALSGFEPPELTREEETAVVAAAQERPDKSLTDALDLFFDAAETETPAPADALTEALEATLSEPQGSAEENIQIRLASLGALLPLVVRTPSRDKMTEAAEVAASLLQSGLSREQQAMAQLLNSVIAMLMRLPAKSDAATEKLVNYLYEQLLLASCPAEALPEAISRFTAWLQQASAVMPLVPAATDAADASRQPQFAYTAKELYFELSELRLNIKEEFSKLRHDLHHHNH